MAKNWQLQVYLFIGESVLFLSNSYGSHVPDQFRGEIEFLYILWAATQLKQSKTTTVANQT